MLLLLCKVLGSVLVVLVTVLVAFLVFSGTGNLFFWKLYIFHNGFLELNRLLLNSCVGLLIDSFVKLAFSLILPPLFGVQNVFGEMPVIVDSSDFVGMHIFLDQFLPILNGPAFSLVDDSCWLMCYVFPNTNVHIL